MKRDFITLADWSAEELEKLLVLAGSIKGNRSKTLEHLKGKSMGLIFQKPSNRTRVSFEVGFTQLGGYCIYLGPDEIDLGKRESSADVAKTLSRYLDVIVARTYNHEDIVELARHASIPVINGLSNLSHPCQALADLLTIQEKFKKLKGLTLAYIGDGNNVCNSLLIGCSKMGMNIKVASPAGYEPKENIVELAQRFAVESKTKILISNNPKEAALGAHIIYTDVWASMGEEHELEERLKIFKNFQVNKSLTDLADPKHIFMHCLPAHRGQEVTADTIDGVHSVVFDQAENRLHAQKAVLLTLLRTKF